ncbi:retrovirus-related pol polyprotein from transposon TNT 1-94 [Tanacetum coccineum]
MQKAQKVHWFRTLEWQQKMFFYLTTLGLARFLKETVPQTTTAKELWESLERKYKTEDAGTKKFVVARFLDYKMVDSKNVISQVQDLQVLLHDIHAEGMTLSETFQVAAIIEKLPPSWVEFKNYLKHKRKEMSVEDLVTTVTSQVTVLLIARCRSSNNSVCADKSMFHSFRVVDNGEKLYMGNSETADIKGEGDVILKTTSEKELKLTNVLYVLEFRRNLVSGWLLNKFSIRLVFESDKFVLSKNQMYVGKGYAVNGMFKLHVMVVKNDIKKMNSSAYLIESANVRHGRLGLYCYVYLLKSKDEAIDKFVLHKTEVENQLSQKIKVVLSDRGGEYVSPFAEICVKHGIRHEFTAPYSPQQNSIVEKKNRTLKEMVNTMLISYGLSQDM